MEGKRRQPLRIKLFFINDTKRNKGRKNQANTNYFDFIKRN